MWYHHFWFTSALVEERIREAERQAALERLYHEAGLETFGGLRAAGRRLAIALGGWLIAVGDRLAAGAREPGVDRCTPAAC